MSEFLWVNKIECQIDGARRSEANRPGKSSNFISNGRDVNRAELPPFVAKGLFNISFCYPIYDWTDEDVFDYLYEYKIPFSNEYQRNGEVAAYWKGKQ